MILKIDPETGSLAEQAYLLNIKRKGPKPRPVFDRFISKVDPQPDGCWLWTAAKRPSGYGVFGADGLRMAGAHRWSYEFFVGPIPEGLVIDHLCRTPSCVNPDHLEPVTNRENLMRGVGPSAQCARKTHCQNGHPFDEENTYFHRNGSRRCRVCVSAYERSRVRPDKHKNRRLG